MTNTTTPSPMTLAPSLEAAWQDVDSSFAGGREREAERYACRRQSSAHHRS